jgi:hypothetical protein
MTPSRVAAAATSVAARMLGRPPVRAVCANRELRLVVVTNDEEVVLRGREEAHQAELRRVDVLELVHADMTEARPPAHSQPRV